MTEAKFKTAQDIVRRRDNWNKALEEINEAYAKLESTKARPEAQILADLMIRLMTDNTEKCAVWAIVDVARDRIIKAILELEEQLEAL